MPSLPLHQNLSQYLQNCISKHKRRHPSRGHICTSLCFSCNFPHVTHKEIIPIHPWILSPSSHREYSLQFPMPLPPTCLSQLFAFNFLTSHKPPTWELLGMQLYTRKHSRPNFHPIYRARIASTSSLHLHETVTCLYALKLLHNVFPIHSSFSVWPPFVTLYTISTFLGHS